MENEDKVDTAPEQEAQSEAPQAETPAQDGAESAETAQA